MAGSLGRQPMCLGSVYCVTERQSGIKKSTGGRKKVSDSHNSQLSIAGQKVTSQGGRVP